MKQTRLFKICVGIAMCYAWIAMAQLTSIPLIKVRLESAKTVFAKTNMNQSVKIAKRSYLQQEYVLDATTKENGENIWCKRGTGESYTDVFRERKVSVRDLEDLKSTSISKLTALLGEPVFMEGPIDFEGTMLYKWRTFNGERGDRMNAIEVAAGFKGGSPTNVLFLLISVAKGK